MPTRPQAITLVALGILGSAGCSVRFHTPNLQVPVVLNDNPFAGKKPPVAGKKTGFYAGEYRVQRAASFVPTNSGQAQFATGGPARLEQDRKTFVGPSGEGYAEFYTNTAEAEVHKLINNSRTRAITRLSIEVTGGSTFLLLGFMQSIRFFNDGIAMDYGEVGR